VRRWLLILAVVGIASAQTVQEGGVITSRFMPQVTQEGRMWYDPGSGVMSVYTGGVWKRLTDLQSVPGLQQQASGLDKRLRVLEQQPPGTVASDAQPQGWNGRFWAQPHSQGLGVYLGNSWHSVNLTDVPVGLAQIPGGIPQDSISGLTLALNARVLNDTLTAKLVGKIGYVDTLGIVMTVSDSLVMSREIQGKADSTGVAHRADTTSYASTQTMDGLRALKTTTITAGNGLTGGGDLSANRTFSLDTLGNHTLAGTITFSGNPVCTANPWADNEIASSGTWNSKYQPSDTNSTLATKWDDSPEKYEKRPFYAAEFLAANANANPPWQGAASTSGTVGAVAAAQTWAQHPGIAVLKAATNQTNSGYAFAGDANMLSTPGLCMEAIVYFPRLDSVQFHMGLHDGNYATDGVDGIAFGKTGMADSLLRGYCSSNSNLTATGSTYKLDDSTWYNLIWRTNSAGNKVYFRVFNDAGTQLWIDSVASNLPTGAGRETASRLIVSWGKATSAGRDLLLVDYLAMWWESTSLAR
jgi:hypothetical protein